MHVLFCFDGTYNDHTDQHHTNILKLYHGATRRKGHAHYFGGPGNEGNIISRALGGAVGAGSLTIRDRALAKLADYDWNSNLKIGVIGFSRGAAIARLFCQRVAERGLDVEFLGCFDTVGAFFPIGWGQQAPLFHNLHVNPRVLNAYHAVSLDEDRLAFAPNLMNQRERVTEEWFSGTHSDVGGGVKSTGLSDVTLLWMHSRLMHHGFVFQLWDAVNPRPKAPVTTTRGFYRRGPREVGVKINDEFAEGVHPTLHFSNHIRSWNY